MLLLIDIGNTNITIGLYEEGLKKVLNLKTRSEDVPLKDITHGCRIEGAVLCSAVPDINPLLINKIKRHLNIRPLIVNHRIKSGLRFRIKNPEKLGSDRIAVAAGARRLYRGNLIVVNFGTATTFSLINTKNEYLGGAIMPGLGMSADALAERTALLPRVKLKAPEQIIGKDTRENMLTGLILGHAGAVERIIQEMRKESGLNAIVVATGGLSHMVVPYIKGIRHVNPHLTLEGLRVLYELNVK